MRPTSRCWRRSSGCGASEHESSRRAVVSDLHRRWRTGGHDARAAVGPIGNPRESPRETRSEEHTSELQSRGHLVCRLLLEKKKKKKKQHIILKKLRHINRDTKQ